MQAALTLQKCGIEVHIINARSFSSIGAVVVSWLGLGPNRFFNRALRAGLNGFLWILGDWDLDSQSALEQLSKTTPTLTFQSNVTPIYTISSSQPQPPKIHIILPGRETSKVMQRAHL